MRRGFKTEAERLADRTRVQLGLSPRAYFPIRQLAEHLGIETYSADELIDRDEIEELDALQPGAFSAVTFFLDGDRTVIAFNPLSEVGRTNSDIAHEIAHILLNHQIREIQSIGGHTFFTCNPDQEEEANWLGGCLLLPRAVLLNEAYNGVDAETIAQNYEVSLAMARFRLNASGVLLQAQRARGRRTSR
jgi:Zn-dependent peptidase ImmA (M78 family)